MKVNLLSEMFAATPAHSDGCLRSEIKDIKAHTIYVFEGSGKDTDSSRGQHANRHRAHQIRMCILKTLVIYRAVFAAV